MKKTTKKSIQFISRSLLWSILVFAIAMVTINWEDMQMYKGTKTVTVTNKSDTILHPATSIQKSIHG